MLIMLCISPHGGWGPCDAAVSRAVPQGPKHAVLEDKHAAILAPKGLVPGRPAD